jgi:hypothetical protein
VQRSKIFYKRFKVLYNEFENFYFVSVKEKRLYKEMAKKYKKSKLKFEKICLEYHDKK